MGKFKEFAEKQKNDYLDIIRKYTVSILVILFSCILYIVLDASKIDIGTETQLRIYIFLLMSAVGTFFTETVMKENGESLFDTVNKSEKNLSILIASYVLSAVGGLIWVILEKAVYEAENDIFSYYVGAIAGLYVLLPLGCSMVRIIRDSGLRFEQYAIRLLFTLIKVTAVLLTLNIGFFSLLELFDSLIFEIDIWDLFPYVQVFLVGILYVPYGLICLTGKSEEKSKFVRGLILFCMMPIIMAAMGIVYLYIFKILLTKTFPSNEVFQILAVLFCFGVCVWTFAYAYTREEPENRYYRAVRLMKYIYAPFLLLEIYCIAVRIADYGFTWERYLALWFIAAQMIYTAWEPLINLVRHLFKKEKVGYGEHYEWMIYVGIGIYVLVMLIPFTQAEKVVFLSQRSRFLAEYGEDEKNLRQAEGSYRELLGNFYGERWIEENYDAEDLRMKMSEISEYSYSEMIHFWQGQDNYPEGIPVEGYQRLYRFEVYEYGSGNAIRKEELKTILIDYDAGNFSADLTGLIEECLRAEESGLSYDFPYILDCGSKRLVITAAGFRYDPLMDTIEYLNLDGFVLE